MLATPTSAGAAKAAENPRFVTSLVLRALVKLAPKAGDIFSHTDLATALSGESRQRRERAVYKLTQLGFVVAGRQLCDGRSMGVYTVTPEGAAAIAAVAQGGALISGRGVPHPPGPGSFRARLWQLLRIRKVLTAEEAAQLLVDAGDARFVSKRNQANEHLRAWAANGVLQLGAKRGPRGQKQYVLVNDPGPAVPSLRKGDAA